MTIWQHTATLPTAWAPASAPAGLHGGTREFHADFDTPHVVLDGTSLDRRPDAVSLDYRTAFTLGPDANGDPSHGIAVRSWRVRDAGNTVVIARADATHTTWEADVALFTYIGPPIDEVDVAFEQLARPVVCAERAGHLWLYWYNPLAAAFQFTDFGVGRTPRIVLDNPADITDADVLVFYGNDVRGAVCYRAQRDRYAVEYMTPVPATLDRCVEAVAMARDNRLHCYYSERNALTGQYTLAAVESTLYPVFLSNDDRIATTLQPRTGTLVDIIILRTTAPESLTPDLRVVQGTLVLPLIDLSLVADDGLAPQLSPRNGTLALPLIAHTLFDIDRLAADLRVQTGTLAVIVIVTAVDPDGIAPSLTARAGTLT